MSKQSAQSDKPKIFLMVEIVQSFIEFQNETKISLPQFHASHNECFVGGYNKGWNAAIESRKEIEEKLVKENTELKAKLSLCESRIEGLKKKCDRSLITSNEYQNNLIKYISDSLDALLKRVRNEQ